MFAGLQGLDFLHANGVLHLDVKPDNIYRDADSVLKLGDFGLAVLRHQWVSAFLGYFLPELSQDRWPQSGYCMLYSCLQVFNLICAMHWQGP